MIVYQCNAKWAISRTNRRYVKMRVSDKSKRQHDKVLTYRRSWFWHETNWNRRHENV